MSVFESLTLKEARFARHCRAAIDLADAQEVDEAAGRLRKAERILNPTDAIWTCEVAKIYSYYLEQYAEAQRVLEPLVEAKNPLGLMEASETYLMSGDSEAAIKPLTIAVDQPGPHTIRAFQHLGLAYLKAEQYDQSARCYQSASAAGYPVDLGLAVAASLLALNESESTDVTEANLTEIRRMADVGRSIASQRDIAQPFHQIIMVDVGLSMWRDGVEQWLPKTLPLTDLHSIMVGLQGAADFCREHRQWDKVQADFAHVQTISRYIREHLPTSGERRELLIAGCLSALAAAGESALLLEKWENWKDVMDEIARFESLSDGRHPLVVQAMAIVTPRRVSGVMALKHSGATTLFDVDDVWDNDYPHLNAAVEAIDLSDTELNPLLAQRRASVLASQIVVTSQRNVINDEALDALILAIQRLTQQVVYCDEAEAEEFSKPLSLGAQLVELNRPGTAERVKIDGKPWPS